MPGPKPSPQAARPRMGGGMNQNLGNLSGEHFDEGMMKDAAAQKAVSQSAADPGQSPTSGQMGQNQPPLSTKSQQTKPKPISPKKELKFMAEGIAKGLLSFFDINAALGIDPAKDDEQAQAKKRQMHSRYQKLSKDEQEYAQELYQEKMQQKQQDEQHKQEEEQRKAQEKDKQIQMPSSPKKGPIGPAGSKKKRAASKLEQDRKGIGKVGGAN